MAHTVDLARLDSFVDDMAAFDARIQAELSALEAQMARLHALWEGDAQQAQRAAHTELMKGMAQMRSALGHLRTAARAAHTNYSHAVTTNQAMMDQFG